MGKNEPYEISGQPLEGSTTLRVAQKWRLANSLTDFYAIWCAPQYTIIALNFRGFFFRRIGTKLAKNESKGDKKDQHSA